MAALIGRSSDSQSLEMFHKHLERDIVGEDSSAASSCRTVHASAHMRRRRVELAQQETRLRAILVTNNVSRNWESVGQQILRIRLGIFEHLFEILVSFLILIPRLSPLRHRLSVEYEDVEKGIEQKDDVGADGNRVKQYRLRWTFKTVRHQRGLNHDQRVVDVLRVEHMTVEGSFVGRVVEDLQELRSTQMEHELRVDAEVFSQTERGRVVLAIVGKLLAEPDEHTVEPAKDVWAVVDLGLENGDSGHEHGSGFLIKRGGNLTRASLGKVARNGGDTKSVLTRGVLVVRDKLDETSRARLHGLSWRRDHLKVDTCRSAWCERAQLPCRGLTDTDLGLADTAGLLVGRDGMPDETRHLELLGALDVEGGIEAHLEVSLVVLDKDAVETLLKDTHLETISEDHVTVGQVGETLHLEQADLVETTGKDVDGVTVACSALGHGLVELDGTLVVLGVVLVNVVVRSDALTELGGDDHTGAFGGRTTAEEHDASTSVGESGLEHADGDAEGDTGAALATLVVGDGPGVLLEVLEDLGELELALRDGEEEAGSTHLCGSVGWTRSLRGASGSTRSARTHGTSARVETKHVLDGLGSILLGAAEDVALGASLVAELVNLGHGTVGDETDESVGRKQAQADDERLAQGLEVVIVHAGVDDVEEDGWDLGRTAEGILDGGVLGKELCGEVGAGNVLVMRRECVARETEGADPKLSAHVDLAAVLRIVGD